FLCFGLAPYGWVILATIPFIALWGIAAPAIQALMAKHVDPSAQGKLQGGINSIRALTGMAGPILYTQVFSAAISPTKKFHIPGAPFLVAAILLLSSLVLAIFVTRSAHGTVPRPAPDASQIAD